MTRSNVYPSRIVASWITRMYVCILTVGSPEDEPYLLRLLEELIKLASIARRSTLSDRLRRRPSRSPSPSSSSSRNASAAAAHGSDDAGGDKKSIRSPRLSTVSLKLPKALSEKLGSGSSNQKSKSSQDRRERTPMSQRKVRGLLLA